MSVDWDELQRLHEQFFNHSQRFYQTPPRSGKAEYQRSLTCQCQVEVVVAAKIKNSAPACGLCGKPINKPWLIGAAVPA